MENENKGNSTGGGPKFSSYWIYAVIALFLLALNFYTMSEGNRDPIQYDRLEEMIADRAVMLDAGRVLATGPLEEVRQTDHPKIQAFFDRRPRARTLHGDLRDSLIVNGERYGTGSG